MEKAQEKEKNAGSSLCPSLSFFLSLSLDVCLLFCAFLRSRARRFSAVTVRKVLLFEWYYISQKGPTVFFAPLNLGFHLSFL